MNKTKINYAVDVILTFLFIIVAVIGFFMYLVIPEGVTQGRYQVYMGLSKATWIMIHNRTSILLTVFVLIHFILHLKWIKCITANIFSKSGKRNGELICELASNDKMDSD